MVEGDDMGKKKEGGLAEAVMEGAEVGDIEAEVVVLEVGEEEGGGKEVILKMFKSIAWRSRRLNSCSAFLLA